MVMELGIRAGLFTADELAAPSGGAPNGRTSVPAEDPLHEEGDGEPQVEETSHELGEESALEDDSFVDFLPEEPDEAEPVEPVAPRTNARGASSASNDRGGEPLQEEPGHDDLSWLCGHSVHFIAHQSFAFY